MGHGLLVGRRSGVDDLEHSLAVITVCPAGSQPDDLLVKQRADQTAMADDQALAGNAGELGHLGATGFPVAYEVSRHLLQPLWRAKHLLDHPERVLCLALLLRRQRGDRVFSPLVEVVRIKIFGQPNGDMVPLIEHPDRRPVVDRPAQIVDVDVVAEHDARIPLRA